MKKLRIVVLSMTAFSLFYSFYWLIYGAIYKNKMGVSFSKEINNPIASNIFVILFMFLIVLAWYIYQLKIRSESVSNGIVFGIFLVYLVLFIIGISQVYNDTHITDEFKEYSLARIISIGGFLAISFIPALLHFVASVATGGYDNVSEPYNLYGFIYTIIGFGYIPVILFFGLVASRYKSTPLLDVFALNDNGLIYTFIILSFVFCAGLRFNLVIANIINNLFYFTFIIWWIVIMSKYNTMNAFLCSLNLIMVIPMFILSIFTFYYFMKIDRFYKGQTKNFLND